MNKWGCLSILTFFLLAACSPIAQPVTVDPISALPPSSTPSLLLSPTPSATPTATSSPTITRTPSPSPTSTPLPSPTSTPLGGGSGVVSFQACRAWYDCDPLELSLVARQLTSSNQPFLQWFTEPDTYRHQLDVVDPASGTTITILDCPPENFYCNPMVLTGSLQSDELIIAQHYQRQRYDGNQLIDIYRVNTTSYEAERVDSFGGYISQFHPLPGRSTGLLSVRGNDRYGELLLYDPLTLERILVLRRKGQFYKSGLTPDPKQFWFRRTDFCETELVTIDGLRAARIMNSDGVIGWPDDENFLVFITDNNPPYCTHNGIAVANRIGLTWKWITLARSDWAMLSPDKKIIVYTSNCNNNGCTRLMVTDLDTNVSLTLIESPARFSLDGLNAVYSPDGTKIFISIAKQIWMFDSDFSNGQVLFEAGQEMPDIQWLSLN
jgi:hypothetical protein